MAERTLEERFETPDVKGEWEPSTRFNVSQMSAKAVVALVREANAKAKREQEYVRFRSVTVEDQFS